MSDAVYDFEEIRYVLERLKIPKAAVLAHQLVEEFYTDGWELFRKDDVVPRDALERAVARAREEQS